MFKKVRKIMVGTGLLQYTPPFVGLRIDTVSSA